MRKGLTLAVSASLAGAVLIGDVQRADACGCFTPPDPTVPVIQSGERIAFARDNGIITAHIQVQYSGPAEEFGWLLPLPSEPELKLGTDELFAQLIATTQPKYRMTREYHGACPFDPNDPNNFGGGGGAPSAGSDSEGGRGDDGGVLVIEASIGPYDYAVLRADTMEPMLAWLRDNEYFVPTATATSVTPYIRPGAFFLALKLQKGNDVGDLQPVVLKYASDYAMIPIILTGVGAAEDMPVLVWMLGEGRAIPRNYRHTVANDALIDWINAGSNYIDVITRAVDEAPEHHSFVTEFAGSTEVMRDLLDPPGRFGTTAELALQTEARDFTSYLINHGYGVFNGNFGSWQFTSQVLAILQRELPVPAEIIADGYQPSDYYASLDYFVGYMATSHPGVAVDLTFDAAAVAAELEERVVTPTLEAGALFRTNPRLTRLFTTISPGEMTSDPVFSYNPDLPDVSNIHTAKLSFRCGFVGYDDINEVPATLETEQGWRLDLANGITVNPWLTSDLPAAARTETLREEGPPEVLNDNDPLIESIIGDRAGGGGCAVGPATRRGVGWGFLGLAGVFVAGLALTTRRRRA